MDGSKRSNYKEIYDLLEQLCKTITGGQKGVQAFSDFPIAYGSTFSCDEGSLVRKITQHLARPDESKAGSPAAQKFFKLYEVLKWNYSDQRLRSAFLHFLYLLSDAPRLESVSFDNNFNSSKSIQNLVPTTSTASLRSNISSASKNSDSVNLAHETISNYRRTQPQPLILAPSNDHITSSISDIKPTSFKAENEIVQNAIYACTGIEGPYLKKDVTGGFRFAANVKNLLDIGQAQMLLRLSQLGYHYNLLKAHTDPKRGLCPLGQGGQGFVTALKNEITQYIGSVSLLQDELNQQREWDAKNITIASQDRLTLMRVFVWASPVLERLQWLSIIAEACVEKKGGALATTIFNFMQHGDTQYSGAAREMLLATCGPLYQMLSHWLLEGEINDPHDEFFIQCISVVDPARLWYDKYRVRAPMLPIFISTEMANKILVAGKSINFLCHICGDKQPVKGGDELQECIDNHAEDIFSFVADTKLHATIDLIYLNTSKRVLDIVTGPYKLLEHLQAMRRYLLLGQGDFIGMLIENLKDELDKPAKDLYSYDLSSIMDAAIRSTNAQFDDLEILNHLDVRLHAPCSGDYGWDIFSLQYTIRGPLATMLNPTMAVYRTLFKPIWRMKHMEFLLSSKIWKEQMCNEKPLRSLKTELRSVFYRLHFITAEMIHFINQMQYYILFEVIECSWVELQERVQQAKALDDILDAHNKFLDAIRRGIFLDSDPSNLFLNLENVYGCIKQLEIWLNQFFQICFKEADARKNFQQQIAASEQTGDFGVTSDSQIKRDEQQREFQVQLNSYENSLGTIGSNYERAVHSFLLGLNSNNDNNLQLFGIRLDFNEYYKKRDQRLGVPLTFEHMRFSSAFLNKGLVGSRHSNFN